MCVSACAVGRIGQCLSNLLSNAIKFTRSNSVITFTLSISLLCPKEEKQYIDHLMLVVPEYSEQCHHRTESGKAVRYVRFYLSVGDEGEGMSEEEMSHLFRPFSQVACSASQHQQRTSSSGLGLSITKSLIDLMNGEISVTSTKGGGR